MEQWLITVVAVLAGCVVTYLFTSRLSFGCRLDELDRKTTANERDVANLSAILYKNDLVNRVTRTETALHDLNVSVQHNIPELFAKWDQLVSERRRNGDSR